MFYLPVDAFCGGKIEHFNQIQPDENVMKIVMSIVAAIQLYMGDAVHIVCEIRTMPLHANSPCDVNNAGTIILYDHIITIAIVFVAMHFMTTSGIRALPLS